MTTKSLIRIMLVLLITALALAVQAQETTLSYPLVDTNQGKCYDNSVETACLAVTEAFYGQDAQYAGNAAQYQDNGDGTITDLVTGLMWQQDPGAKMTYAQAVAGASALTLAGNSDWRLPTIKELYSLILFDGTDASGCNGTCSLTPFIDTRYFHFSYGDTAAGERIIDSQFVSSTRYVSTTMLGDETVFGVNFADGRIKGYGMQMPMGGGEKTFYVLYVRGNTAYGLNQFSDSGNGTITDSATGLTWMQSDSGAGMNWESALSYCENLDLAGAADWRLPNVKELQSIVDYTRSPDTTQSAAIDPLFSVTAITNEAGETDYPFYWSSTTHADAGGQGVFASYVSFGRAEGYMVAVWRDVHGAGAQRSDPKSGDASEFAQGHGPQGDAVRIDNYVRCVRGGQVTLMASGADYATRPSMTIQSTSIPQGGNQVGQNMPPAGMQPVQSSGQTGQQQADHVPPPEAVNACGGSSQGAACQFSAPNGAVSGTCQPIQQQMACVPANHP
jgi:hypothetical protein